MSQTHEHQYTKWNRTGHSHHLLWFTLVSPAWRADFRAQILNRDLTQALTSRTVTHSCTRTIPVVPTYLGIACVINNWQVGRCLSFISIALIKHHSKSIFQLNLLDSSPSLPKVKAGLQTIRYKQSRVAKSECAHAPLLLCVHCDFRILT